MGLALLIFLSVTLGLTAGLHLLSDLLFPEATRVRRRVAQEFGTDKDHAAISPLFKDFDPAERKQIVEKFRMKQGRPRKC